MNFKDLCDNMQKLEDTSSRLDKVEIIAEILRKEKHPEVVLLLLEGRLFPAWSNEKLGISSKMAIKAIASAYGIKVSQIESDFNSRGDLGLSALKFCSNKTQQTLMGFSESKSDLTINKVYTNLKKLPGIEGAKSSDIKLRHIVELLTGASGIEAKFLIRLVIGDMRIGVSSGTIRDAIIKSEFPEIIGLYDKDISKEVSGKVFDFSSIDSDIEKLKKESLIGYDYIRCFTYELARAVFNLISDSVQQAYDKLNEMARVAEIVKTKGLCGLMKVDLDVMIPIRAMLMQKVKTVEEAVDKIDLPFALEYKYDGFRCQVHLKDGEVRLFTRNLENVTAQFPDIVANVKKHVKVNSIVMDGEILGVDKDGNYLPFQNISQRIKRKHNVHELVKKMPVIYATWDVMYLNGKSIIDLPLKERRQKLIDSINQADDFLVSEQLIISDVEIGDKFYKKSLKVGNEGVVVKDLSSSYKPGNRVGCWLKIKPIMDPLDLVIVGAQWGEGKRASWLTSFIVACRDSKDSEKFYTIGKVGTGFKELETDKENSSELSFSELTDMLKPLIIGESRKDKTVRVKPEVVITLEYEEIQKSPTYDSGFALRFPRFVNLREDLDLVEVDDLDKVKDYFGDQ